ncbi:MAG TPA: dipicolinic acid synthetase [Candidatus Aphodomonas merdavium]|nr:dipicolinic acid synthetase [Candidatus Aphodomonas merdavium]
MRLIIIGGDERNRKLTALALARGHEVALIGHGGDDLPPRGLYQAAVFPLPIAERDGCAPAPNAQRPLPIEEAMAYCADGARVYAAGACPALALAVREKGCVRIDPLADEAFVQANAAITAECAIGLAISQSESCLYDGACLVLGYGRIGRALALRLRGLCARVTVAARRACSRAQAQSDGMDAAALEGPFLPHYSFLFNTIPAPVADSALKSALLPGALAMDLASAPYGVDLEATGRLGVRAVRASGLPGRCAPESAARAMLALMEQTDGA